MYAVSDSDAYPSERDAVQRLAPQPRSIAETGLSDQLLADLLCKHLHEGGALDMSRLVERLTLPGAVLEEVLGLLRKDGRIEVLGQHNGQALRYGLTERGRNAARAALERSGYVGAAPFPVSTYRSLVKVQTIHHGRVNAERMRSSFSGVVLADDLLDQLVRVVRVPVVAAVLERLPDALAQCAALREREERVHAGARVDHGPAVEPALLCRSAVRRPQRGRPRPSHRRQCLAAQPALGEQFVDHGQQPLGHGPGGEAVAVRGLDQPRHRQLRLGQRLEQRPERAALAGARQLEAGRGQAETETASSPSGGP